MTVWSPWVDAKYSPSAENASAIVDFAVSGRGMYEADLPEPYMSSRLQSSRSLRLRPVSSRWNSSECTPVRLRELDMADDFACRRRRTQGGQCSVRWDGVRCVPASHRTAVILTAAIR